VERVEKILFSRAWPVVVRLRPREWSLEMLGEKSILTKSSSEIARTDTGENTKKAKIKNPEIKNLFLNILLVPLLAGKCFCIIGLLYCSTWQ